MDDDWPKMPGNVWSETDWYGSCLTCDGLCHWIDCPTGGWWAHNSHPADHHDANLGWQPMQDMDVHGHTYTVGSFTPGEKNV